MTGEPAGHAAGPSLDDIARARVQLAGVAVVTPLEESRWLSAIVGGPVSLKAENLQRAGSFKIRGAYLRMLGLSAAEREAGVVAASAGNHAQGVALAAQLMGITAVIFMPHGAPIVKENATRGYGAQVRFHGASVDDALVAARAYAEETGAALIHPFDHPDIVAGQATVGAEILEQCPGVRTILVPAGGGGLLAGIAAAVKQAAPEVAVVGVQASGAAAFPDSLRAGFPVPLVSMATMADGIAVGRPGDVPFAAITTYVDAILTVEEESISRALLMLLERAKMVVEPAGAAGVAAVLEHQTDFETPMVVVLSGGNVDPVLMLDVIRHGLATSGRYLDVTVRIPDRPGGLARLLADLAESGANVLDVVHQRHSSALHIGEVAVEVQLETRGPEHTNRVTEHLRARGYPVVL